MPGIMQLISLIYGFLGFPLVTQIVIQSEAKDLGNAHFDVLEILRYALNDKWWQERGSNKILKLMKLIA